MSDRMPDAIAAPSFYTDEEGYLYVRVFVEGGHETYFIGRSGTHLMEDDQIPPLDEVSSPQQVLNGLRIAAHIILP